MHYYDYLIIAAAVLVDAYIVVALTDRIKKSKYNRTITIGKVTEDGEQVSTLFNLSSDDSEAEVARKLSQAYQIGDDRRAFVHQRFVDKLENEKSKNKLKAVNQSDSSDE